MNRLEWFGITAVVHKSYLCTEDPSLGGCMSFTLADDLPLGFNHSPAIETLVSRLQIAGSAASQLPCAQTGFSKSIVEGNKTQVT